jgi:hypothetical protein
VLSLSLRNLLVTKYNTPTVFHLADYSTLLQDNVIMPYEPNAIFSDSATRPSTLIVGLLSLSLTYYTREVCLFIV